jgi:hypothetical protein
MDRYALTAGNRRPSLPKFRVRWNYVTRWSRASCWHDAFREPAAGWLATTSLSTAREDWLLRAVVMAGPLLETKLHVPRWRRSLVARPRLSDRLSRGAESALTLVSAPAGFGKTTLLAEWLAVAAAGGRAVAWLSLDQRDNDPVLFWTYLVAALKAAAPGDGAGALSLLQPPGRRARRALPPCLTTSTPSRTMSCWCSTTTTSSRRARCRRG